MILFDNVAKTYPDGTEVLKNFNLEIPAHQVTTLVGSSGSGKTTLLRMINRMVDPSSGRILLDGKDIAEVDPVQLRRSIGYVLQDGGLLPHRSVLDNAALTPRLTGASKAQACELAEKYLLQMGLKPELFKRYPAQLSGGQRQRVGVARALAAEADLLLMDEPFGALDPIVRKELQCQILQLQQELKKTIVFVTHDIDEALMLGDEVVVLRPGGIIAQQASPEDLLAHPEDDFVREFVGLDSQQRQVQIHNRDGVQIAVDGYGRPIGIIGK